MLSTVILGTGNVAQHLFKAFTQSSLVEVVQVVGRKETNLEYFSKTTATTTNFDQIKDADVYLIAVKDDAIPSVSRFLKDRLGIVAHTSGAVSMDFLESKNNGVFYPLQTFTKGREIDLKSVPICIEAKQELAIKALKILGNAISEYVYEINSLQRKKLHLAAVYANNFVNHLYGISETICLDEGLPFALLQPLIKETANKVQSISPKEAQTGPAIRNDKKTMNSHLKLLKKESQTELYTLLSKAIKETHEEKL
ncbi:F420-dependent NADP oxidoreductase [Flagellimonas sp. HMM57]|uniref:Rossmann-like and DUF2520 domain-containing protein n=1 Tax=unclassified Flagellimonas TaxID=2644544 RepID=UPI0013CFD6FA|nr:MULTISPECIES: Rossmann-like and DUF2520 domain-containing protein [unclassified Flagellimonas]UII76058.1 F420-dependent NADP oxidoreductase [Flagellimonas sp. HMM57]